MFLTWPPFRKNEAKMCKFRIRLTLNLIQKWLNCMKHLLSAMLWGYWGEIFFSVFGLGHLKSHFRANENGHFCHFQVGTKKALVLI